MSPVVELLLGIVALLFGRRLHWLLVAITGFLAGLLIVNAELVGQPAWLTMLVACGVGVLELFTGPPIARAQPASPSARSP